MTNVCYDFVSRREQQKSLQATRFRSINCINNRADFNSLSIELFSQMSDWGNVDKVAHQMTISSLRSQISNDERELFIDIKNELFLADTLIALKAICRELGRPVRARIWEALDERLPKEEPTIILIRGSMSRSEIRKKVQDLRQTELNDFMKYIDTDAYRHTPEGRRQSLTLIDSDLTV